MHSKIQKYKNKWCELFFRHFLTYQACAVSQNLKLEVTVKCLTWLVRFLGKKLIFTSKVYMWHIYPTSSPCCTARIATKLFPVHCHIINIQTLKYHFPTVCTWGVMQLLVNPIWSTILGLSPAQRRVNMFQWKIHGVGSKIFSPCLEIGQKQKSPKIVHTLDCLRKYFATSHEI